MDITKTTQTVATFKMEHENEGVKGTDELKFVWDSERAEWFLEKNNNSWYYVEEIKAIAEILEKLNKGGNKW